MFLNEELNHKWKAVLDHPNLVPITDMHKRACMAMMLENAEQSAYQTEHHVPGAHNLFETGDIPVNLMGASASTGQTTIDTFDPVLISLIRRSLPNLISYDLAGVQPMSGPTGLIFALRSRYTSQAGVESFFNEANTEFSSVTLGTNVFGQWHIGQLPAANGADANTYNTGSGMSRAQAETLGTSANVAFAEMALSIEKVTVEAKSRALKAGYTLELAQDLKAIHGLNAEDELSNILQTEILAEINREFIRTLNFVAKNGSQTDTAVTGTFDLDVDANGRWSVEKFKGLHFHLEREANIIAKETRRGKGNIMLCSADVASALNAAGLLSYTPQMPTNLQVDDTGNTFAGTMGRIRVYIDPYAIGGNYFTMGFKGGSPFDAGLFYCPYIPLQMVRAIDPDSMTPRIGFKTRYGIVNHPFAGGGGTSGTGSSAIRQYGALIKDSNVYFRKSLVTHLM